MNDKIWIWFNSLEPGPRFLTFLSVIIPIWLIPPYVMEYREGSVVSLLILFIVISCKIYSENKENA